MLVAFFLQLSYCFWDEPHKIVARIAQKQLTVKQVNWLRDLFNIWPGEQTTVVNSATWPDDLKGDGSRIYIMGTWHYADEPILSKDFTGTINPISFNVTDVLRDSYDCIMNPTTKSPWALHFAIRNIVHFVGDVHTPLHAAGYYSPSHPNGDSGGNLYKISCNYGAPCRNLHAMWDSALLTLQTSGISSHEAAQFEYNVTKLLEKFSYKLTDSNIANDKFRDWLMESNQISKDYAYSTPEYEQISDEYLELGREQVLKRISLAGHRLAYILTKFFDVRGTPSIYPHTVSASEIVAWILDVILVLIISFLLFIYIRKPISIEELSDMSLSNYEPIK